MSKKHIIVEPYNSGWKNEFEKIKTELDTVLGELALSIEHVGSTSVHGLSAKPIIDIDVIINDRSELGKVISALETIGYYHQGNKGINDREAFGYNGKEHMMKHHLYVCPKDSAELKRHLKFRDHLSSHPEAVKEYSRIKEEGAELYPDDIDRYIEHKSPFIEDIYRKLGL